MMILMIKLILFLEQEQEKIVIINYFQKVVGKFYRIDLEGGK